MKKFYVYLIAAIVLIGAGTASAQIADFKGKKAVKVTEQTLAKRHSRLKVKGATTQVNMVASKTLHAPVNKLITPNKRIRRATELITAPEGETKTYTRSGSFYYRNTISAAQSGIIDIVFGENNDVYFKDILGVGFDNYIKGTIDGDKIVVDLPQTIYNYTDYNVEIAWLDITAYLDGTTSNYYSTSIMADRANTQAVFTIDGNTISLEGSSENYILAGVYDDDDMWLGVGDYGSVYTLLSEDDMPKVITPPEGAIAILYYYTGKFYDGSSQISINRQVAVVQDGNDIYFQGLMTGDDDYEILPEAWVKGTLDGNTVTIPMGQYVGRYGSDFMYVVGRGANGAADVTFTYDPDAETFTLDNNMYVNGKPDAIYYYIYHLAGNVISLNEPEPESEPELVEVPETATIENDWIIKGTFTASSTLDINKATEVAFDGSDVYIKGLAYYFPDSWIKGNISGNTAIFPAQFVGRDDYGDEYLIGASGDWEMIEDIVFEYDADKNIFTLQNNLIENDGIDDIAAWAYYDEGLTVSKGELEPEPEPEPEPEVVVVPDGLQTETWTFNANILTFEDTDDDESTDDEAVYTPTTLFVEVGFDGNDVYVQGLCQDLPEAWVKGTRNGNTITFASGQYFGLQEFSFWGYTYTYPHYLIGYGNDDIQDVVLNYDEANKLMTTNDFVIDNESATELNYYVIYTDVELSYLNEVEGRPEAPSFKSYTYDEDYGWGTLYLNIPLIDVNGNQMNANKVFYRIYSDIERTIKQLEFTPEEYRNLTETMTEIPYTFTDDYDIYPGGAPIYINHANAADFNRIGVQVVNYSGMDIPNNPVGHTVLDIADNESDIVWFEIKNYAVITGISDVNTAKRLTGVRYYNVNGQSGDKPFSGVNIMVRSYSDGSTVTTKSVNK